MIAVFVGFVLGDRPGDQAVRHRPGERGLPRRVHPAHRPRAVADAPVRQGELVLPEVAGQDHPTRLHRRRRRGRGAGDGPGAAGRRGRAGPRLGRSAECRLPAVAVVSSFDRGHGLDPGQLDPITGRRRTRRDHRQGDQTIHRRKTNDLGGIRHVAVEVPDAVAAHAFIRFQQQMYGKRGLRIDILGQDHIPEEISPVSLQVLLLDRSLGRAVGDGARPPGRPSGERDCRLSRSSSGVHQF